MCEKFNESSISGQICYVNFFRALDTPRNNPAGNQMTRLLEHRQKRDILNDASHPFPLATKPNYGLPGVKVHLERQVSNVLAGVKVHLERQVLAGVRLVIFYIAE